MLIGPPGNGKTATIKAVIRDSIANKVSVLYARRLRDARDRSSPAISAVFKHARANAPCLLVFEDLDSLVEPESLSVLLNELDGLHSNEGILILASTNHPESLDEALLHRPSRFDQQYTFELPDRALRRKFIEKWLHERVRLESFSFEGASMNGSAVRSAEELVQTMVEATAGWSFAFLKELFIAFLLNMAGAHLEEPSIVAQGPGIQKPMMVRSIPASLLLEQLAELSTQVKAPSLKAE